MSAFQVDNSTYPDKVSLRITALKLLKEPPVVLETHGGSGEIFQAVYQHVPVGTVIEKDRFKVETLAYQRPGWAVYQGSSPDLLRNGAGSHLTHNVLDVDPYGDPWPTIKGFFQSPRPFADEMVVVVNDGLRTKIMMGTAWDAGSLEEMVEKYGNDLYEKYLPLCRELMEKAVNPAGYAVKKWAGYYCGQNDRMTHYACLLTKEG